MSVPLQYIDDYFNKQLTDTEKLQFEEQCREDRDFARDVAFYINAREAIRQKLLEEKVKLWTADEQEIKGSILKKLIGKCLPYAAAACLLVVILLIFLSRSG